MGEKTCVSMKIIIKNKPFLLRICRNNEIQRSDMEGDKVKPDLKPTTFMCFYLLPGFYIYVSFIFFSVQW